MIRARKNDGIVVQMPVVLFIINIVNVFVGKKLFTRSGQHSVLEINNPDLYVCICNQIFHHAADVCFSPADKINGKHKIDTFRIFY